MGLEKKLWMTMDLVCSYDPDRLWQGGLRTSREPGLQPSPGGEVSRTPPRESSQGQLHCTKRECHNSALAEPTGELKKDLLLNQIHSLNRHLNTYYVPNLGDTETRHTQKAVTVYE